MRRTITIDIATLRLPKRDTPTGWTRWGSTRWGSGWVMCEQVKTAWTLLRATTPSHDTVRCEPSGYAACTPQHFLYFFPLPQGQSSLRPTLGWLRTMVFTFAPSPCACADASAISPPPPPTATGTPWSAVWRTFSLTPYPPVSACVAAVTLYALRACV